MIEIRLIKDRGFKAVGHAGGSSHGHNIVCAGVSALTQAAALGMISYRPNEVMIKDDSGYLEVTLLGPADRETQAILKAMQLGLAEMVKQYPEQVKLVE